MSQSNDLLSIICCYFVTFKIWYKQTKLSHNHLSQIIEYGYKKYGIFITAMSLKACPNQYDTTTCQSKTYIAYIKLVTGLDKIEFLQSHENLDIYQKSFEIIENYFGSEGEDGRLAPEVSSTTGQYQFGSDQSVPMGGFQF